LDFTIKKYRKLLEALIAQGYAFQTFAEFLERPEPHSIILRHDVEAKYDHALAFAKIQNEYQIRGTYYFRVLPNHFSTEIIQQIASLGHETGYHYDDLSHCKGDYDNAIKRFEKNLANLNKIAKVRTICMEGAPLSRFDNRDLWKKYNYRDYGIIGEPYFDLDFSKVLYLTDTGRRWDGEKVSVRDKVGQLDSWQLDNLQSAVGSQQSASENDNSKFNPPAGGQNSKFHTTSDIITAANNGLLPDQVMFTFHPQRWTDMPFPWLRELVLQNVKNVVKRWVVQREG
jgi:tetratricopeptide (TPR) repeat protein